MVIKTPNIERIKTTPKIVPTVGNLFEKLDTKVVVLSTKAVVALAEADPVVKNPAGFKAAIPKNNAKMMNKKITTATTVDVAKSTICPPLFIFSAFFSAAFIILLYLILNILYPLSTKRLSAQANGSLYSWGNSVTDF